MTPEQLDDIERRAIARSALDDREKEVLTLVAEVRRLHRIADVLEDPTIHATRLRERALAASKEATQA